MLARADDQTRLERIFRAALAAVNGYHAVRRALEAELPPLKTASNRYFILAAGKAAFAMAKGAEDFLDEKFPQRYADGLVVTKTGHGGRLRKVKVLEAAHPVPDERGLRAAQEVFRFLRCVQEGDVVLVLLSGGASALLPAPPPGVKLEDKQELTRLLLTSGAAIQEINALRKHLSLLKGGRLVSAAKGANLLTLAISDVPGDDPQSIGSGLTVADETTLEDCWKILRRYDLVEKTALPILAHLKNPAAESPKPGDRQFMDISYKIIASNRLALAAAAKAAEAESLAVTVRPEVFTEDVAVVAETLRNSLRGEGGRRLTLSGGEPTVKVTGDGLGGRNTELALRLATVAAAPFSFLAAGTDGTDGPTDAAGAFADETTVDRGKAQGLLAADFLRRNDSFSYFERLGDLLKTGPTATNVMDLHLMLI